MARRKSTPNPKANDAPAEPERKSSSAFAFVVALLAVGGLIWFMQREANELELERALRTLPGADSWLDEKIAWCEAGSRGEARGIWVGVIDELVRTAPEDGTPELLALKLRAVKPIAGAADRKVTHLYVTARGFDFVAEKWDEPLTGQRWLVATYENEHSQRTLQATFPAPVDEPPRGEVAPNDP